MQRLVVLSEKIGSSILVLPLTPLRRGIAEADYYNTQAGLAQAAIQYYCLRYTTASPDYTGAHTIVLTF